MKNVTKILLGLAPVLALLAQSDAVQSAVGSAVAAHPALASVGVLLSIVGALLHDPKKADASPSK